MSLKKKKLMKMLRSLLIAILICAVFLFVLGVILSIGSAYHVTFENDLFWRCFFVMCLIVVICFYKRLYLILKKKFKKSRRKKGMVQNNSADNCIPCAPYDFRKEARDLIKEAKDDFDAEMYKNAYSKASQAIRVYLSYKNGWNKEITNAELLKRLKDDVPDYVDIKECLNLCLYVEFAKQKAIKKDFYRIIGLAERIVGE